MRNMTIEEKRQRGISAERAKLARLNKQASPEIKDQRQQEAEARRLNRYGHSEVRSILAIAEENQSLVGEKTPKQLKKERRASKRNFQKSLKAKSLRPIRQRTLIRQAKRKEAKLARAAAVGF